MPALGYRRFASRNLGHACSHCALAARRFPSSKRARPAASSAGPAALAADAREMNRVRATPSPKVLRVLLMVRTRRLVVSRVRDRRGRWSGRATGTVVRLTETAADVVGKGTGAWLAAVQLRAPLA